MTNNETMEAKRTEAPPTDGGLTKKDAYAQACEYFYYHAGQRTTMMNFFIAVFGALLTLYSTLLSVQPMVGIISSVFMGIISLLFYMIDLRNRFDVKKSECVIRQIERDHSFDRPVGEYPYGVFSNETNTYKHYDLLRRFKNRKERSALRRLYKQALRDDASAWMLEQRLQAIAAEDPTVSVHELKESLHSEGILSLSSLIKVLYLLCLFLSILAFVFALLVSSGAVKLQTGT